MFITVGWICNRRCVYCTTRFDDRKVSPAYRRQVKAKFREGMRRMDPAAHPPKIAFTGGGEPLLHMDEVRDYLRSFRAADRDRRPRPWFYLYTNGLHATRDRLKELVDLGLDEIRFHLGASDYSRPVRRRLQAAAGIVPTVTVETPAWPPHRRKLFETLPFFEEIGLKHLNLGEVHINGTNAARIAARLPRAKIYHLHLLHLHDGGLVYDIMERVAERRYSFSVLDCSGFVKQIQRGPGKLVFPPDVRGLCSDDPAGARARRRMAGRPCG